VNEAGSGALGIREQIPLENVMSPKFLLLAAALLGLAGCVSAPYSPDTGYSQGYPPAAYGSPGYYYSYGPTGYVAVAPAPTPASICTDTPAGC
jgi:hypothetical protein